IDGIGSEMLLPSAPQLSTTGGTLTTRGSSIRAGWLVAGAVSVLVVALSWVGRAAGAKTPDPDDVAAGMRLYRQKGDCQACHGWAADGRKMDSQMPDGANLRTTRLDRNRLIAAIKCGRP